MTAQRGETEVWLVDLEASGSALAQLGASRGSPDPTAWQVAKGLVLTRFYGSGLKLQDLVHGRAGQPQLPAPFNGAVSFAHCRAFGLIGVSRGAALGVDIEAARAIRMPPSRRTIIVAAARALATEPLPEGPDAAFLQAWVRLEALAKAHGGGIGRLLTAIGAVGPKTTMPAGSLAAAWGRRLDLQVADLAAPSATRQLAIAMATRTPITPPIVALLPTTVAGLHALAEDGPDGNSCVGSD